MEIIVEIAAQIFGKTVQRVLIGGELSLLASVILVTVAVIVFWLLSKLHQKLKAKRLAPATSQKHRSIRRSAPADTIEDQIARTNAKNWK